MPKKSDIDLSYAFGLEPKDAVAYFEAKGYKIGWNWWETAHQAHAQSVTVAKVARMDVLEAIRTEVAKALKDGTTGYDFEKTLKPKLQALGWWGEQISIDENGTAVVERLGSPHRLRTIYRTNLQVAYMTGRYKGLMEQTDLRPYWMYVAVMDSKTRRSHATLNGKVFRFDDPIWKTHYPPNGWGCRCRVRALSEANLQKRNLTVESSAGRLSDTDVEVGVDYFTGESIRRTVTTYTLPDGSKLTPDGGWNHNAGFDAFGSDVDLMRKLTQVQDATIRQQTIQALNNSEARHTAFSGWVSAVLERDRLVDEMKRNDIPAEERSVLVKKLKSLQVSRAQTLGFVSDTVAAYVVSKGFQPARVLVTSEHDLAHANSRRHIEHGVALSEEEYKRLPQMLAKPEAVLWDSTHNNLLYVFPSAEESGRQIKIVVNAPDRVRRVKGQLDVVINAFKVNKENLANQAEYDVIEGSLK